MVKKKLNLEGTVPDNSTVALLLIDVINDLDFPEADALLRHAVPMAKKLAALKTRAYKHGCAVIYVNDNFGRWRSDFKSQVQHCLAKDVRGRKLAELLQPSESDYFVLKPAHSGFYSTALDVLLKRLGTKTLIITGIATNMCVLFTANDAYLRNYRICVPSDCVAANTMKLTRIALEQMRTTLKAQIMQSTALPWKRLFAASKSD
jgi:nicotinamidase-related amidase